MRCPTCNADLPDGLVRCTSCNTPLDDAAELGFDQQWDDPHASGVDPHASGLDLFTSAQGTREQPQPAPNHPGAPEPAPAPGPETSQAAVHTRIVTVDPEQERGTRIIDVSVPQVARRAGRQGGRDAKHGPTAGQGTAELSRGVEDLFDGMKRGYARMHRVDRLTTWIGFLALVSAFLPWRYELGRGLIAGIQGLGAASAAAFFLVLICIFARTARRRLTGLLLTLQILAAGGGTAVPIFVFLWQTGAAAKFGLHLTALGGAVTIVLTLMRLAVRNL